MSAENRPSYTRHDAGLPDADTEREDLMNSSLISKIEKAKRYSAEPDRVHIQSLDVSFRGDNGSHKIRLSGDEWSCECDHFVAHGLCAPVMPLQRYFWSNPSGTARLRHERIPA